MKILLFMEFNVILQSQGKVLVEGKPMNDVRNEKFATIKKRYYESDM